MLLFLCLPKFGMEWFGGSINEAISRAKLKGALFVVAVHGGLEKGRFDS